jgi:hypothetical protein
MPKDVRFRSQTFVTLNPSRGRPCDTHQFGGAAACGTAHDAADHVDGRCDEFWLRRQSVGSGGNRRPYRDKRAFLARLLCKVWFEEERRSVRRPGKDGSGLVDRSHTAANRKLFTNEAGSIHGPAKGHAGRALFPS